MATRQLYKEAYLFFLCYDPCEPVHKYPRRKGIAFVPEIVIQNSTNHSKVKMWWADVYSSDSNPNYVIEDNEKAKMAETQVRLSLFADHVLVYKIWGIVIGRTSDQWHLEHVWNAISYAGVVLIGWPSPQPTAYLCRNVARDVHVDPSQKEERMHTMRSNKSDMFCYWQAPVLQVGYTRQKCIPN